jgi:hypothetical protein
VQAALASFGKLVEVTLQPPQVVIHDSTAGFPQLAAALAGSHYGIKELSSGATVTPIFN